MTKTVTKNPTVYKAMLQRHPAAMTRMICLLSLAALPAAAGDLDRAALSARLYALGVAQADAVLVLGAARLRKDAGFAPMGPVPMGWAEMLDRASDLAEGDEAVAALIDDTRSEAVKGVSTGPLYRLDRIGAGASQSFAGLDLTADTRAEVYVEPESAVDLNLVIRDAQGRVLCADTAPDPIAYCAWLPSDPGPVTVKVTNAGPQDSAYALLTN